MFFPNLQLITKSKNFLFYNNNKGKSLEKTTYRSWLKKDTRIANFKKNEAILIFNGILDDYKEVTNFLKNNNIKKIIFFIDDIFRCHVANNATNHDRLYQELDIISSIIKDTNITLYKIFHCEVVPKDYFSYDIGYLDLFLLDIIQGFSSLPEKKTNIDYKISCFNNRVDIHRMLMSTLLCKEKNICLTVNNFWDYSALRNNKIMPLKSLRNDIRQNIKKNHSYIYCNQKQFLDPLMSESCHLPSEIQYNNFTYDAIERSFCNLVTETTFTTDFPNISEKTIKPIAHFTPFLILGAPHSLQLVQKLGFKTFHNFWDESYDSEEDHVKRFAMVYDIVQDILDMDKKHLKRMYKKMTPILNYNQRHLKYVKEKMVLMNDPSYFFTYSS